MEALCDSAIELETDDGIVIEANLLGFISKCPPVHQGSNAGRAIIFCSIAIYSTRDGILVFRLTEYTRKGIGGLSIQETFHVTADPSDAFSFFGNNISTHILCEKAGLTSRGKTTH